MEQEIRPEQHPPSVPTTPQTSGLAIGSLVASILGLTFVPTVGSVVGLVLGYMARREIREKELLTGEGLATAGIVLGWIGVILSLLALCLAVLVIVFGFAAVPGMTICANLGHGF